MASNFLDTATGLVDVGGINIVMLISGFIGILIFGAIGGVLVWYVLNKKQWKYTLVIFEKVNGRLKPTDKDKGKNLIISNSGDTVLMTKKNKKILPMPRLQTGINTYWYEITEDGEWINIEPASIDGKRKEMHMHFLDPEMRYARQSLAYIGKERYNKASFMEKYGGLLAYTVLIFITGLSLWFIASQLVEVASTLTTGMDTAEKVMSQAERILGALDNLKGGSGIS